MGDGAITCYSGQLTVEQAEKLRNALEMQQWELKTIPHARYAYFGDNVNVVVYLSGKVVVQGNGTKDFVQFTLEPEILKEIVLGYDEQRHPEWFEEHAGLDESGKGDLFGPLVSACVIGGGETVNRWIKAGVRDSKTIHSKQQLFAIADQISRTGDAVVEVFTLSVRKYNELYLRFGNNLNRLLAWYHSKSLQNARDKNPVAKALLDQFSTAPLVQRFFTNDSTLTITMRPRAEDDPVVAAASIVARAEYLRAMERLSETAGEELLRGASTQVEEQARRLVARFGFDKLGDYAKLHFSTAQKAIFG
ncbi:MAG: ribonuclease HIII [Puniceicoccales bacterium]|jgi:ribonuclease HIII|nr:ribonuclease HIII [Puniceicoccales bacterium]